MLFRSQDKTVLIDGNKTYRILKDTNSFIIVLSSVVVLNSVIVSEKSTETLARYSTLQKALKVLAQLEESLIFKHNFFHFPKNEDVELNSEDVEL